MRKVMLAGLLALAVPASAVAASGTPSAESLAKQACKTERAQMGTKTFKKTYAAKSAAKARAACLAKAGVTATKATKNAAQECKTERAADETAFNAKYGANKNGRNAYGKCVSTKVKASTDATTAARVNAAKTCKAMAKADLAKQFGTKRNAFGKCVSATAKAQPEAAPQA